MFIATFMDVAINRRAIMRNRDFVTVDIRINNNNTPIINENGATLNEVTTFEMFLSGVVFESLPTGIMSNKVLCIFDFTKRSSTSILPFSQKNNKLTENFCMLRLL